MDGPSEVCKVWGTRTSNESLLRMLHTAQDGHCCPGRCARWPAFALLWNMFNYFFERCWNRFRVFEKYLLGTWLLFSIVGAKVGNGIRVFSQNRNEAVHRTQLSLLDGETIVSFLRGWHKLISHGRWREKHRLLSWILGGNGAKLKASFHRERATQIKCEAWFWTHT